MWDEWTPAEEQLLCQLAGTMDLGEIARILSERFGVPRTRNAVDVRCQRLGVSHWAKGMSLTEMERLFGLDHRAIVRHWVDTGLLAARRWSGRGPHPGWWFEPADVERFIREHPWAYDWTRMKRGHRLTRLAEVVNRADPWLPYEQLRRYVGIAKVNLDRWRRRGLVPHKRRPGAGGYGQIVIRARDFRPIKQAIERARAEARRARSGSA
ncbi:MAG: hypothetical protein AB1609_17300 [Bacillota bacterium]